MQVFVLNAEYDYEGCSFVGVYSTFEKAHEAMIDEVYGDFYKFYPHKHITAYSTYYSNSIKPNRGDGFNIRAVELQ